MGFLWVFCMKSAALNKQTAIGDTLLSMKYRYSVEFVVIWQLFGIIKYTGCAGEHSVIYLAGLRNSNIRWQEVLCNEIEFQHFHPNLRTAGEIHQPTYIPFFSRIMPLNIQ